MQQPGKPPGGAILPPAAVMPPVTALLPPAAAPKVEKKVDTRKVVKV